MGFLELRIGMGDEGRVQEQLTLHDEGVCVVLHVLGVVRRGAARARARLSCYLGGRSSQCLFNFQLGGMILPAFVRITQLHQTNDNYLRTSVGCRVPGSAVKPPSNEMAKTE
jgi:hypothetical protein